MSDNNESDLDEKPSPETLKQLYEHDSSSEEAGLGNGDEASEECVAPSGFDASKLKAEAIGHKIVEPELDFEEEVIHEEKDELSQKDGDADEEGVIVDNPDDHEEGEADEGEVTDEDDLEEGEVKDGSTNRKVQPRPICRFFNKGQCTWGTSCRFIHPGVNDKGNYNMFAPTKPAFGSNMLPGPPPPPMMMMMMGPGHNYAPRMGMRGPDIPFPVEDAPPVESAWERGLRHAKEILKKASRRKEQEPDFEEKRLNLSIDSNDKAGQDFDKDNDYYGGGRSPPYRHSESYGYGSRYDDPVDTYENSDRESREVWRSGRYENFEVRWPRQEFENRERGGKDRSRYQRSYDREKYDHRSPDDERLREGIPTRGDEWRDPWRRSKTPKNRSRSRARSRRSYSSASSRSFSSRSSRSSYSYSRSSSSRSSYYSSESYSKSRSRSPFSRLDSPSPMNRSRNYDRLRQESSRRRRLPYPPRSPMRLGHSPPLRSPRSPPSRVHRSPPLHPSRSPLVRSNRSLPLHMQRSPQPIRVIRNRMSPDTTKQIPLPPMPVPTQQTVQPAKDVEPERESEIRSATKNDNRSRLPRSYSGSESSHSISRSVSRSSSSASRSRSRSPSRSRSFSRSRSISMSSVSSASGSGSSSDSESKKRARRSPSVKEMPLKPAAESANQGDQERGKGVSPKALEVVPPREKRISMVLPKQLHTAPIHPSQTIVTPIPKMSKDLLRQSGQKPQIKLTLLSKAPPPPSALEQSPIHKEVAKQKPPERDEAKKEAATHSRKRPLSPPVVKPPLPVAPAAATGGKRSTTSRREELLKQLKAVEDAIARKRAKII